MAAPTVYDLGALVGDTWHQYASSVGQVYYTNHYTQTSTYTIPTGWEDAAGVRSLSHFLWRILLVLGGKYNHVRRVSRAKS
jgi:hypothetical protein